MLYQYRIIDDIRKRIQREGPLNSNIAVAYISDHYRRLCELCYKYLHSIYNFIKYKNENTTSIEHITYNDLFDYFKQNDNIKELVEFINPHIRHSESHLGTQIVRDKKGKPKSILFHDSRKKKRILVAKYDFKHLVYMMNRLKNGLTPALFYAFTIYLIALELLVYRSMEFKFLLLRIGQD